MSSPIRLFFYRAKSGVPNFGDELSQEVVAFVTGRRVQLTGRWRCELTGIGSVLDRYVEPKGRAVSALRSAFGHPVMVWGSGLISDRPAKRNYLKILAVRGALTRDAMCAPLNTPLGDPGLLVAKMMKAAGSRKGIGIVPHYTDKAHPMVDALSRLSGVRVIDVERGGAEVCDEIAGCDVVFSSSLHGLIIADAFGIPNRRLTFWGNLKGGDFKFLDYASSLGRKDVAAVKLIAPQQVLTMAREHYDLDYQACVEDICSGLESALQSAF